MMMHTNSNRSKVTHRERMSYKEMETLEAAKKDIKVRRHRRDKRKVWDESL